MATMRLSSYVFWRQVFRQQSEVAKIEQHQRQHAGKVKVKEAVITSQIEAEEHAHQRAVAARKVLAPADIVEAASTGTMNVNIHSKEIVPPEPT